MNDKNVRLMDELMQTIAQTDEWQDIQNNDPEIKCADAALASTLCKLNKVIPRELRAQLEDDIYSYCNAVSSAAMLYGIHVVEAIRDVSARPYDLSRHVMKRMGRAEEAQQ